MEFAYGILRDQKFSVHVGAHLFRGPDCQDPGTRQTATVQDTLVVPISLWSFLFSPVDGWPRPRPDSFLVRPVAASRRILRWSYRFPDIRLCLVILLSGGVITCKILCRVFHPECLWHEIFCHADHARSFRPWCRNAAVCSIGGGCQSRVHRRHVSCSHGHMSVHVVLGGFPVALNGDNVSTAHRRHEPQCRRAGARSTSVVATWATGAAHDARWPQ